jgi:hypothetical protein
LQVAIQPRGRALAGFLDRVRAEFERDAAGVANPLAHALGKLEMMAVARREIAAGLGDADDRPARLDLFETDAEIEIALDIERRHVRIGGLSNQARDRSGGRPPFKPDFASLIHLSGA